VAVEALEPGDTHPAQTFGRYVLLKHMADGAGSGPQVHLGRRVGGPHDGKMVAIKRMAEGAADRPDLLSRWLRRARRATKIQHAAVVPTLDVLAASGDLFAVQLFQPGVSFARILRLAQAEDGRIDASILARLICPALQGLHAAHETVDDHDESLNIVHGNLTPERLLVTPTREILVADFGFPMGCHSESSSSETLRNLAPEQLSKQGAGDRRSDVYAIGVLLWEALTGRSLYTAGSKAALLNEKGGPPLPPSAVVSELPSGLDRVVVRALAPRPTARYRSANQLAHAFEAALDAKASDAELNNWLDRFCGERLDKLANNHHQLKQILIPEAISRQASASADGAVTSLLSGPLRDSVSEADELSDDQLPTIVHASEDEEASMSTSLPRPEPQRRPPESWLPERDEARRPKRKTAVAAPAPTRRSNWMTLGLIAAPVVGLVVAAAAAKLERFAGDHAPERTATPPALTTAPATIAPVKTAAPSPSEATSSPTASARATAEPVASTEASAEASAAPSTSKRAPRVAARRYRPRPAPTPKKATKTKTKKKKKKKGPKVDIVSDYGY